MDRESFPSGHPAGRGASDSSEIQAGTAAVLSSCRWHPYHGLRLELERRPSGSGARRGWKAGSRRSGRSRRHDAQLARARPAVEQIDIVEAGGGIGRFSSDHGVVPRRPPGQARMAKATARISRDRHWNLDSTYRHGLDEKISPIWPRSNGLTETCPAGRHSPLKLDLEAFRDPGPLRRPYCGGGDEDYSGSAAGVGWTGPRRAPGARGRRSTAKATAGADGTAPIGGTS